MFLAGDRTLVDFAGSPDKNEVGLRCALELDAPVSHQRARFGLAEQAVLIQGRALEVEAGKRNRALILPPRHRALPVRTKPTHQAVSVLDPQAAALCIIGECRTMMRGA